MKWRSIETAPTNGKAVLAVWGDENDGYAGHMVVWFWNGEWTCVDNPKQKFVAPAFWMPLPRPPQVRSALRSK